MADVKTAAIVEDGVVDKKRLLEQASAVVAAFPGLTYREAGSEVVLEGTLVLTQDGDGFDEYAIALHVPYDFPLAEPRLFEVGGRIPVGAERHVNTDRTACYEVFEYWLATADSKTLLAFVEGPVVNFFLSQTIYEITGEWEFGERRHGVPGLVDAVAEAVGAPKNYDVAATRLRVLRDWPDKGHHECPCRSGRRFRDCHRAELTALHQRVSPKLAARMVERILKYIAP